MAGSSESFFVRCSTTATSDARREISEKATLSLSRSASRLSARDFICVKNGYEIRPSLHGRQDPRLLWCHLLLSVHGDDCTPRTVVHHRVDVFLEQVTKVREIRRKEPKRGDKPAESSFSRLSRPVNEVVVINCS